VKRLPVMIGTAVLGGALALLGVVSAPESAGSGAVAAPSAATVAEAHAAFVKAMSAHAPVVGIHGWISPGAMHGTAKATNGSVTGMPSANWSGYADAETTSADTFSYVSAHWTIPYVTCPSRPYQNQDAFIGNWVGLDGFNNQTVEQLGTATQCFEDVTYYYVWYEMYPAGTVEEGTAACINNNVDCPRPGDQVSASVSVTPVGSGENNYTLSLTDYTTPDESFSVTQQCAVTTCVDSSAEWIVERPALLPSFGIVQLTPLGDYYRTGFTRGTVVSGGVRSSIGGFSGGVYDIAMIDDTSSYYLDCPGQTAPPGTLLSTSSSTACPTRAPTRDGSFTATWDSSY
jgi:hypothetical protein